MVSYKPNVSIYPTMNFNQNVEKDKGYYLGFGKHINKNRISIGKIEFLYNFDKS